MFHVYHSYYCHTTSEEVILQMNLTTNNATALNTTWQQLEIKQQLHMRAIKPLNCWRPNCRQTWNYGRELELGSETDRIVNGQNMC